MKHLLNIVLVCFRFVGRPGDYNTLFGARQEEVGVDLSHRE